MSSKAVRDDLRQAWALYMPELPYYDVINRTFAHNGLPTKWATFLFEAARGKISIGCKPACYRETGSILVVIMTTAGNGDSEAGALANLVMQRFNGYSGVDGQFIVLEIQPPNDGNNDRVPKSNFYQTVVEFDYQYDTFE